MGCVIYVVWEDGLCLERIFRVEGWWEDCLTAVMGIGIPAESA